MMKHTKSVMYNSLLRKNLRLGRVHIVDVYAVLLQPLSFYFCIQIAFNLPLNNAYSTQAPIVILYPPSIEPSMTL